MAQSKPIATPMTTTFTLLASVGDAYENPNHYHDVVVSLQYITITSLDLTYVVNKGFQFMAYLLVSHWLVVKRFLRYLCGTSTHGL